MFLRSSRLCLMDPNENRFRNDVAREPRAPDPGTYHSHRRRGQSTKTHQFLRSPRRPLNEVEIKMNTPSPSAYAPVMRLTKPGPRSGRWSSKPRMMNMINASNGHSLREYDPDRSTGFPPVPYGYGIASAASNAYISPGRARPSTASVSPRSTRVQAIEEVAALPPIPPREGTPHGCRSVTPPPGVPARDHSADDD